VNTSEAETMSIEKLREIGALPPGYTPKTEIGWRLVRLRAKFIENGGKFLSDRELEEKIAGLRD
jgi:hypothetical protein